MTLGPGIQPRVSAVAATGVLGMIGQHGGDAERILGAARLGLNEVDNPNAHLDLRRYCDLFEQAATQTGVDDFGLRFGRTYRIEDMGPLGALVLCSPCLGIALTNLCANFAAVQEHSDLQLRAEGNLLRLEYQIRDGRIANRRHDAELSIGIFSNIFRRALGPNWAPEEVHFEHLRAAAPLAHQNLLNAPVYFAQATNAIIFRRNILCAPMPNADTKHLSELHAQVRALAGQARPDDFIGLIVSQIRRGLATGDANIGTIAANMGLSQAKLYRRLAALNVDFSNLTQTIRRELALSYATQTHIPLTDIAALLGYSELSAFSRAFKRWTGLSPAAYRERAASRAYQPAI